jgi:surface antigen
MRSTIIGLTAAISLSLALPAAAQINPFRGTNAPPMSKADLDQMFNATQRLNERNPLMVGNSEKWEGETSGTVHVERIFRAHGTDCHAMSYHLIRPVSPKSRTYKMTWCRAPDGKWKTAP